MQARVTEAAVRAATPADLPAVCEIVNHYIATTAINFRTEPQTPAEWQADFAAYEARYPWLVATDGPGRVTGLAYGAPWKTRAAYDWSVEVTVYVAHDAAGRGIGRALYARLLAQLDAQGFRTQLASIVLPNAASVALHEAFGFRHTGTLAAVGYKLDRWHDVGLWQRRTGSPDEPARPLRPPLDLTPDGARGPGSRDAPTG